LHLIDSSWVNASGIRLSGTEAAACAGLNIQRAEGLWSLRFSFGLGLGWGWLGREVGLVDGFLVVVADGEGAEAAHAFVAGFLSDFPRAESLSVGHGAGFGDQVLVDNRFDFLGGLAGFANVLAVAVEAVLERLASGFCLRLFATVVVVFEGADGFPDAIFGAGDDFGGELDAAEVGGGLIALDAVLAHGAEDFIDGDENAAGVLDEGQEEGRALAGRGQLGALADVAMEVTEDAVLDDG
jgi:hypothetical protein